MQKGADSQAGEYEYSLHYYHPAEKFIFSNYNGDEAQSGAVADATWYFVECIYDPTLGSFGQIGIALNGGSFIMSNLYEGGISTFSHALYVGNDDNDNFIGAGLIDEAGIINDRLPTADERAYLYNSGTGRSLY